MAVSGLGGPAAAAHAGPADRATLLPDLVQDAPSQLRLDTVATPKGPRFQLGFRSGVANAGTGPLVIEGRRAAGAPRMTAAQIVERSGGRPAAVRDDVGTLRYTRAPDHRHWHLLGFERYELRTPDGRVAATDQKTGFCLGDRYDADVFSAWENEPASSVFRQFCGKDRPGLRRLRQGISVGYGDEYGAQLEGQFVDLTGVPAGSYDLVHRVNADGRLLEARYDNNVACLGLRIAWPGGPSAAPLLSQGPCHATAARRGASASQVAAPPAEPAPEPGACPATETAGRAAAALRAGLRRRRLLDPGTRWITARFEPCGAGRITLRVVHRDHRRVTVIARASREVEGDGPVTMRVRITRAGRRFAARLRRGPARTVRMRVRATYAPASSSASTSASTS